MSSQIHPFPLVVTGGRPSLGLIRIQEPETHRELLDEARMRWAQQALEEQSAAFDLLVGV